ncbi:MAG: RHS repeat-associated core domain-containing protein [Saprospiraceae bacterium]
MPIQHIEYTAFGEAFADWRTETYDTPYRFTGKEQDSETGLYYYGARYYDPRLGRFLSVDPLAEKYGAWSPYAYTFDNPLKFNDPTGMGAEDIIIEGRHDDKKAYYEKQTLNELQSLTSQKLSMDDKGNVTIIEGVGNKNASAEGTKLVADLINDHSKTTKITNETKYSGLDNSFLKDNARTRAENNENVSNEVGTNSTIYFSPEVKATFTDTNCDKINAPVNRVLAHELGHADLMRTGTEQKGKAIGDIPYLRVEQQVIQKENKIFIKQRYDGTNGPN